VITNTPSGDDAKRRGSVALQHTFRLPNILLSSDFADRESLIVVRPRKNPVTTIQAVILGMMLALTPSLVLLAFLLWREEIGLREVDADSKFDDQPPYPNTQ
jgi:hypothetical protein